jgi:hypothetical protein
MLFMPSRTRLPNKTQWALQDMLVEHAKAIDALRVILNRNETKFMDPMIAMQLARLSEALGRIQAITVMAQNGMYAQNRPED